jgi:hypothetical protein
MEESILKLQCLQLAHTGTPDISIQIAEKYYNWIVDKQPDKQLNDQPKRGRPYKQK